MASIRNNLRSFKVGTFTLAVIFAAMSHGQQKPHLATQDLPEALLGTWQITNVHIDTEASWRRYYERNDPRLVGRLFTIDRSQVHTSSEEPCMNPGIAIRHTTAAELIKNGMAGRYTEPTIPTPTHYQLPLSDNTPLEALSVSCKNGLFGNTLGRSDGIRGAWIVILHKDQLAIRWYDETILLLRRLPDNFKPSPSFNCEKATTVVEKTICGSVTLAALDQNMAQTYQFAVTVFKEADNPQALKKLKATQKQWLTKRNACAVNHDCLTKSMEDRMQEIEAVSDLRGQ